MREPSHVLRAMGVADDFARGTVRFSLGHLTTTTDLKSLCELLLILLPELRAMRGVTRNVL
jgi:cysteine desulfurase